MMRGDYFIIRNCALLHKNDKNNRFRKKIIFIADLKSGQCRNLQNFHGQYEIKTLYDKRDLNYFTIYVKRDINLYRKLY